MSERITPGDTGIVSVTLYDRAEDQYPQAKLYDSDGNLRHTINLSHIADGHYQGTFTPSGKYKYLTGVVIIYSDAAHTTINEAYDAKDISYFIDYNRATTLGGGVVGGISSKELEEKLNKAVNEIKEELSKKPSFDPKKDKVMIDQTNINKIQSEIDLLKRNLNKQLRAITENQLTSKDLEKVKKNFPDYSTQIKNLLDRIEYVTNSSVAAGSQVKKVYEELSKSNVSLSNILNQFNKANSKSDKSLAGLAEILSKINRSISVLEKASDKTELVEAVNEIKDVSRVIKNMHKMLNNVAILNDILDKVSENGELIEALNKEEFKRFKTVVDNILALDKNLRADLNVLKTSYVMREKMEQINDNLSLLQSRI